MVDIVVDRKVERAVVVELPEELVRRKHYTDRCWQMLRVHRDVSTRTLGDITSRACVYVTGSLARDEAADGSDIDLFVVHQIVDGAGSKLTGIEYARLLAALDELRENAKFRPFSRGGFFLKAHSFSGMVELLGLPDDDAQNAFTARMLLLMNSRPLINDHAYHDMRRRALDAYWMKTDPSGAPAVGAPEEARFPVMLVNDLRRWWGAVALNFESQHRFEAFKPGEPSLADRRIANLKLRYARMLGVHSVLVSLCSHSTDTGMLLRSEVEDILDMTPIERLLDLAGRDSEFESLVERIIGMYAAYLEYMNATKADLRAKVADESEWRPIKDAAYDFHDKFTRLFQGVGREKLLYDYCLI